MPQSGRHLDRGGLTADALDLTTRTSSPGAIRRGRRALSRCPRAPGHCPVDAGRRALGHDPSALLWRRLRWGRRCSTSRSLLPFTMSNSVFLCSRGAFLRPGCSCSPHLLAPSSHPPRNEGAGGAPGGALPKVSRPYGATSRLRGVSRPAQPGRRLSALHRGVAGPGTRCVSGVAAGDGAKARRRPLVMAGCGPGVSNPRLRAAFDATPRSACRIVSGRRPLMSEDANPYHGFAT